MSHERDTSNKTSAYRRRAAGRAFTMVELLTAVAIIGILIAILIPAVNGVRVAARKTASEATLTTLRTGLEALRADQTFGDGAYAPSESDITDARFRYRVRNPYDDRISGARGYTDDFIEMSGAGLLVWALAGADLLGPPGFKVFRSENRNGEWARDTHANDNGPGKRGAYALNSAANYEPFQTRAAPFVDISKIGLSRYNEPLRGYEIPIETEALASIGQQPLMRTYPMFLDAFGAPILYWRADTAGSVIASAPDPRQNAFGGGGSSSARGIYDFRHNGPLVDPEYKGPGQTQSRLVLRADHEHHLAWGYNYNQSVPPLTPGTRLVGFPRYVQNDNVPARPMPYNEQSFLLVSPGPDLIYGTGDDITNFPHNGAELVHDD